MKRSESSRGERERERERERGRWLRKWKCQGVQEVRDRWRDEVDKQPWEREFIFE